MFQRAIVPSSSRSSSPRRTPCGKKSECYRGMGEQQMASGGSVSKYSPSGTGSLPRRLKSSDCFIVYSLLHGQLISLTHTSSL